MDKEGSVICVVDDDESVRKGLRRLLKSGGFMVESYASASDFLDSVRREICACLVLDVRMPGMDGLELQRRLVSSGVGTPIIFITAHDDKQAETEALTLGAVAFLYKPFDGDVLLAAVRAGLEAHAGGDAAEQ